MTVLLYDYHELEERTSRSLKAWKAWHIVLYILIVIFGIMNYTFLLSTKPMVDDNCVLYPRELVFRMVELPISYTVLDVEESDLVPIQSNVTRKNHPNITIVTDENGNITKREIKNEFNETDVFIEVQNMTVAVGNRTHRLLLDTKKSWFAKEIDYQFAEYMPVISSIFAVVWITMFIMCPSGGRVRSGLQQPWRILAPALVFAVVMVFLTGHSFLQTNGGLQAFCAEFRNYTNATTCSSVNPFLERSYNTSWSFGSRAGLTRAACAGVWAGWACAAALLLARCLASPDFSLRTTAVHLAKDPAQKITPYLKKSPRRTPRPLSPHDDASIMSETTLTSQLVTATVERENSTPTSSSNTPSRTNGLKKDS